MNSNHWCFFGHCFLSCGNGVNTIRIKAEHYVFRATYRDALPAYKYNTQHHPCPPAGDTDISNTIISDKEPDNTYSTIFKGSLIL
jgi:hypothetical protein